MADQSMLSLFDETSNFLDDLTASSGGDIGMSMGGDAGLMGTQGNVMIMNNMAPQPQPVPQPAQGFQQQQQQMPGTMHSMNQNQLGYNQFGAQTQTQKLHHITPNMPMPNQTQQVQAVPAQGMQAVPAQGMMSPQHSQFGSPPPTSPHVTRPPGPYSMSPMHNGPRMPQPQQINQMNMNQGNMWNQAQNGPTQPQQLNQPQQINQPQQMNQAPQQQLFIQQQQQQQQPNMQPSQNIRQQNMPRMPGQPTQYLSHHDYALPATQAPTQRLSHFPEPQTPAGPVQPNQTFNMQPLSSPPGTNRLSHMPVNNVNNNMNRISGQMTATTQTFPASSQGVSLLGNTNMGQTQPLRHANFPTDINMQRAQINAGQPQMNSSQNQHFTFPNQLQNQQPVSQPVNETTPLTHFPNTSPTQNAPFHPQFQGMQQQTRPVASARPTPPPPSLTPTMPTERLAHPPTQTQGNFSQSSLQQLEQLLPQNSVNAAQPRVLQVSSAGQTINVIKCVPNPSGGQNFQNMQVSFAPASVQKVANTTVAPSVNTSIANRMVVPAQASPNTSAGLNQQMQQMNAEIQQLQQQIQQFYNMQQTPQTQQKMLDLQERMRTLKAQQQQKLLRERQVQQQQMGQQSQLQQKPGQPMKQIVLTIQNQQQQKKQIVASVQNRPVTATSAPQGVQVQRIQLRQMAPQNVVVQQKPQQQTGQTVQSLLQQKPQGQIQVQTSKPQIIIQQKPATQTTPQHFIIQQKPAVQQQSKPILITQLTKGTDSKGQQVKVVTLTPQNKIKTVKTIIATPVSTPEKTSPTIMTPPSTTPTSQSQPPSSTQLNTPPTLTPQESSGLPEPISPAEESSGDDVDIEAMDGTDRERLLRAQQAQEKANRIVQEALAKAHASGNTNVRVMPTTSLPEGEIIPVKKKKKKSGSKRPKEPKPPKEPKEKKTPRPKTPRPKPKAAKKKKPLPTFLKKKKRKTGGMSDDSEPEQRSPVESDKEDDDLFKRRSSRNTKRKKYMDDLDLQLTEDEKSDNDAPGKAGGGAVQPQFFVENPAEEDAVIVEKVLGMRTVMKQVTVMKPEAVNEESHSEDVNVEDEDAVENKENKRKEENVETIEVEEFFIKYKNFSYLHCEWKAAEDLKDKRIHMKIKRYKQKRLSMGTYFLQADEDEMFNSDYAEVDRILEESITFDPDTNEKMIYYMVKWRALPYEDSTWELEQDVEKEKVEQFKRFQKIPTEEERELIARPKPSDWKKLDKSRTYKNDNNLRAYQLEGVNWLTFCYYNKQNCILADEMGLGKTIQSITYLHEIYDYGIRGPFLVIAPLSTIGNWQREFETWSDLNVITYHGTAPSRSMLQEYEMYLKDEDGHRIPDMYKFHALITTYETIISDVELLSSIDWRATVIDEAHRLKNQKCKLMEGLKVFDLEHRVLLTGTPLQNNVEELFSLLNFLEPSRFNNSEEFLKEFGELKTESQVDKLKLLLKPLMLRRLKEDVEKNLAAKEETIVEVELTNIQKKYYRAILEKNFTFLNKGAGTTTNVPNLMNTMMELRKCCNHPYLVKGAEEKIVDDAKEEHGTDPWHLFMAMVKSSGKLVLIDKLLPKLMAGNHKVLIFSQMIRVLDILEDYLIQKKYLYERIDGRIRGNLRQEAIDRFSKPDSDRFVFLLCTRAGGLGINLTAADTVIIFDSDWNPQNDLQAQARCHRIGQTKAVKVYRLITRNSYEREMFDRASMKLGLDRAVLQSMAGKKEDQSAAQAQMSKKEIEDLLRKGAYGAIMDDDEAGDQFCEEDIDLILKRRTQVIQVESEGKGSIFAKASFSVTDNRDDIDIDDPNFWNKWAKKAEIDTVVRKNDLIMEQPRARRQTTRFGNQDLLDMSELDTTSDSSNNEENVDVDVAPNGEKLKGGKKGKPGRKKKHKTPKVDLDAENTPVEEGVYSRGEFFKVEKNLLVYGWGRWEDILLHGRFKRKLQVNDVQHITRALLVYSLKNYAGDERIKGFIWDLVNPQADKEFKNHSGLSAPVPRGRKGRKARNEANKLAEDLQNDMANCDINLDAILTDEGYKKHLQRHANKVLLRVRLLYYLKQEVIGEQANRVFANYPASEIDIPAPHADGEPPIMWWDTEADKSLLIGIYKHGYEKFNIIRQDSCLCFLNRCGPPDGAALLREQNDEEDDPSSQQMNDSKLLRDDEMDVDDEDICPGTPGSASQGKIAAIPITYETDGKLSFPGPSEINTRLRRVITGYQRGHKKEQLKLQQKEKKLQRRERFEVQLKEREVRKRESQQKWSRREETDFYRIVSTFGVQFDPHFRRYNWETFRQLARLDKKYDDTLTEYFLGFYYMCCRVCKKLKEDAKPPNNLIIEPITEERANRCLARIDLLNKVREEVLMHPKLDERLELCQSSFDLPDWWTPGVHDRDLLIGAARHGLARTDYHILHDPTLSFREIVANKDLYKAKHPTPFMNPSNPNTDDLDDKQDGNKSDARQRQESESDMDTDAKPEVKQEAKSEKEDGEIDDDDDDDKDEKKEVKVKPEVKVEVSQEVKDKRAMEEKIRAIEAKVKAEIRARLDMRDESMDELEEKPMIVMKPEGFGVEGWTPDASLMGDDDPAMAELMARSMMMNPAIQWPKDRVVFHRLEHICYCIEKAEWPLTRRPALGDSMDNTPSGTPLPIAKPDTPHGDSSRCDTPELFAQGDGLKMKIQKKKKRRKKHDIEAERTARLRELYGVQVDSDSQQDSLSGMRTPTDSLTNDTNDDTDNDRAESSAQRHESQHGIGRIMTPMFMGDNPKKRSRKRKIDRVPDDHSGMSASEKVALAMAQATAGKKTVMHRAHKLTRLAPEAKVPVVNIEDGSRLSGEEAPSRLELEEWLDSHPGYMVDLPDDQLEQDVSVSQDFFIDKRKKRRPRLDPTKLDLDNLTGEENVSVVNKVTGKRITGAKAPPLKHLTEWLTQNANFFVDPKWAHLVKEKGNLPESLHSRILFPSEKRRGRPPTSASNPSHSSPSPYPSASQMNAMAMANPALMKLGMGIPFGALPNLGMNPMFNMTPFGLPITTSAATKLTETEAKNDNSDSDEKAAASAAAFPLMYNPMLYNSIIAAQMGNFNLPGNIPTSFATLAQAQAQMLNGAAAAAAVAAAAGKNNSDSEDNPEQVVAQDLSIKKKKKHSPKEKTVKRLPKVVPPDDEIEEGEILNLATKKRRTEPEEPKSGPVASKSKSEPAASKSKSEPAASKSKAEAAAYMSDDEGDSDDQS